MTLDWLIWFLSIIAKDLYSVCIPTLLILVCCPYLCLFLCIVASIEDMTQSSGKTFSSLYYLLLKLVFCVVLRIKPST
jgi:hypothetical protein